MASSLLFSAFSDNSAFVGCEFLSSTSEWARAATSKTNLIVRAPVRYKSVEWSFEFKLERDWVANFCKELQIYCFDLRKCFGFHAPHFLVWCAISVKQSSHLSQISFFNINRMASLLCVLSAKSLERLEYRAGCWLRWYWFNGTFSAVARFPSHSLFKDSVWIMFAKCAIQNQQSLSKEFI